MAYYPLSSCSGTLDFSYFGNNATATGDSYQEGPPGGLMDAVYLPGDGSVSIMAPGSDSLDAQFSLTLLMWVYAEAGTGSLVNYGATSALGLHLLMSGDTATLIFIPSNRDESITFERVEYANFPLNQWVQVAATYSYNTYVRTKWLTFYRRYFEMFLLNKTQCNLKKIPLKFASKGPIDKKSALVQVMASYRQATSCDVS